MNKKKISIIIHETKHKNAEMLFESLKQLDIPGGFAADIISIREETSTAKAYNDAMQQTDAKYKVYINENVLVVAADILQKIIDVFATSPELGLLGVSGVRQIPVDARHYQAKHRVGKILLGKDARLKEWESGSDGTYSEVMTVDKYIMATQYDIPWRDDSFTGISYYEASQSIEFRRHNYKVGVVYDAVPWIWRPFEKEEDEEALRNEFIREYSRDCFPLVSVIIPTYNRPVYFEESLQSALNQTYQNLDIFVTDNSQNDLTEKLIQKYLQKDKRIKYVHNSAIDADGNWLCARRYNNPEAEYVKYLMDDDILCPTQIERMMQIYFDYPEVALVTSYRKLINENGEILPDYDFNKCLVQEDSVASGELIGRKILTENRNMIGEPTTVLIKKKYLRNNDLGWTGNEGKYLHYLMPDYQTYLHILTKGDLFYITEPLSYLRLHAGQGQFELDTGINSAIGWSMEIEYAWKCKIYLKTEKDYKRALASWLSKTSKVIEWITEKGYYTKECKIMYEYMKKAVQILAEQNNQYAANRTDYLC